MAGVTGETRKDRFSGAGVQLDHEHFRTHVGQMFSAVATNGAIAPAADFDMLIIPGTIPPHTQFQAAIGGSGRVQLFEGTTVTANGTPVPAQNRNRLSSNVALTQVFSGPTVTAPGAQINDEAVPGGGGPTTVGGGTESFNEWILIPGTLYLVRLTNLDVAAQIGSIKALWYEASNGG